MVIDSVSRYYKRNKSGILLETLLLALTLYVIFQFSCVTINDININAHTRVSLISMAKEIISSINSIFIFRPGFILLCNMFLHSSTTFSHNGVDMICWSKSECVKVVTDTNILYLHQLSPSALLQVCMLGGAMNAQIVEEVLLVVLRIVLQGNLTARCLAPLIHSVRMVSSVSTNY